MNTSGQPCRGLYKSLYYITFAVLYVLVYSLSTEWRKLLKCFFGSPKNINPKKWRHFSQYLLEGERERILGTKFPYMVKSNMAAEWDSQKRKRLEGAHYKNSDQRQKMSYQLYRNTTLGNSLQESLDELIQVKWQFSLLLCGVESIICVTSLRNLFLREQFVRQPRFVWERLDSHLCD